MKRSICLTLVTQLIFSTYAQASNLDSAKMKIHTPAFEDGAIIPRKYTCDGADVNPPLLIEGVPNTAQSLVLIVDDPDAPRGTWNHWLLWNIDPTTKEIKENTVPRHAVQGTTDFGTAKYGGPCPPSGTHRYFFRLYALDTKLNLPQGGKRADLDKAMQKHAIDQAVLMGRYSRSK